MSQACGEIHGPIGEGLRQLKERAEAIPPEAEMILNEALFLAGEGNEDRLLAFMRHNWNKTCESAGLITEEQEEVSGWLENLATERRQPVEEREPEVAEGKKMTTEWQHPKLKGAYELLLRINGRLEKEGGDLDERLLSGLLEQLSVAAEATLFNIQNKREAWEVRSSVKRKK